MVTRWYGEKSKPSLWVSLDLLWTAVNGGNISFRRAQWENVRLQRGAARFANSVWLEISAEPQWIWDSSTSLHSFLQNGQNKFFLAASLSPAADSYLTQLITTVGIESRQPLITFSVRQKQSGLSLFLGITRKMVVSPLQELTVIDTIILIVLYTLNDKLQVQKQGSFSMYINT